MWEQNIWRLYLSKQLCILTIFLWNSNILAEKYNCYLWFFKLTKSVFVWSEFLDMRFPFRKLSLSIWIVDSCGWLDSYALLQVSFRVTHLPHYGSVWLSTHWVGHLTTRPTAMRTNLNLVNKTEIFNSYPISFSTYSFKLIKWSNIDFEKINITIRTKMTGHWMYHRISTIKPHSKGGKRVFDVRKMCVSYVSQLHEYFYNKKVIPLYNNICKEDNNCTPPQLTDTNSLNIRYPILE